MIAVAALEAAVVIDGHAYGPGDARELADAIHFAARRAEAYARLYAVVSWPPLEPAVLQ